MKVIYTASKLDLLRSNAAGNHVSIGERQTPKKCFI